MYEDYTVRVVARAACIACGKVPQDRILFARSERGAMRGDVICKNCKRSSKQAKKVKHDILPEDSVDERVDNQGSGSDGWQTVE